MPQKARKRRGFFLAVIGIVFSAGLRLNAQSATPDHPVFEEWSIVVLDGKRCGFASTVTTQTGDGAALRYKTVHTEEFVFKRETARLRMVDISTITEDGQGVVLDFHQVTEGSGSRIESSGQRDGDEMVVSSRGQTRRYPLPALDALGPETVRRQTEKVPLRPGQTFSFNTFSSDYPQGTVIDNGTIEKQEDRTVLGHTRSLWKITSTTSILPGLPISTWVDNRAQEVEVEVILPGLGTMHEFVTDRADSMKQPEGAEIFSASLIHPRQAIPQPEKAAKAVYRLSLSGSSSPLHLWNGDEQHVLHDGPGSAEIEITAPHFTAADATWKLPRADTPDLHIYLQPTSYLEVNNPLIQSLARKAIGRETNPVIAAQLIERFVRGYITKKDLNVGFASAEETAENREGDCTEHAVLCAALGRAAGLPTRCVMGFGYIPPETDAPTVANAKGTDTGVFAFHMWAEAWIGPGQWVPMDAALNGFDVGHIAITKTALDDVNPLIDLNAPILHLLEDLKIEVLKITPKESIPSTQPNVD